MDDNVSKYSGDPKTGRHHNPDDGKFNLDVESKEIIDRIRKRNKRRFDKKLEWINIFRWVKDALIFFALGVIIGIALMLP